MYKRTFRNSGVRICPSWKPNGGRDLVRYPKDCHCANSYSPGFGFSAEPFLTKICSGTTSSEQPISGTTSIFYRSPTAEKPTTLSPS